MAENNNSLLAGIISIHAPPRGATGMSIAIKKLKHIFQFTPLREGRPIGRNYILPNIKFQFTPLREGRRVPYSAVLDVSPISIHAPPRGAT